MDFPNQCVRNLVAGWYWKGPLESVHTSEGRKRDLLGEAF